MPAALHVWYVRHPGGTVSPCSSVAMPLEVALACQLRYQGMFVLQVWEPVTGKLKKDLTYQADELFMMHDEAVLALAFNRESTVLVSGG